MAAAATYYAAYRPERRSNGYIKRTIAVHTRISLSLYDGFWAERDISHRYFYTTLLIPERVLSPERLHVVATRRCKRITH